MSGSSVAPWRPLIGAFVIWFVHFMGCWVAVEVWPRQWAANALAWALTAVALAALGAEGWRLRAGAAPAGLDGWNRRIGRGAVAIAAAAVVFGALPSLVFLPPGVTTGSPLPRSAAVRSGGSDRGAVAGPSRRFVNRAAPTPR